MVCVEQPIFLKMLNFTNFQTLKTEIAIYNVGEKIKFWDTTDRTWIKGEIIQITECSGYFVNLKIGFKGYKKEREVQIYRKNWLSKL